MAAGSRPAPSTAAHGGDYAFVLVRAGSAIHPVLGGTQRRVALATPQSLPPRAGSAAGNTSVVNIGLRSGLTYVAALVIARRAQAGRKKCRRKVCMHASGFDLNAWKRGYFDVEPAPDDERYYYLEPPALPKDIVGTMFRVGPGKFTESGSTIRHQMDGDGHVLGLTFNGDGKVIVRHRFVVTQGLLRDKFKKRLVMKGAYGSSATDADFFDKQKGELKNTSNAGVLWWQDRLAALSPFGMPHVLDQVSLGTVIGNLPAATSDLGSALNGDENFGEAPRLCATSGSLANISQQPSMLGTTLRLYEFPSESWIPTKRGGRRVSIDGYAYFSSWALTPKLFIAARPPLKVIDVAGATFGKTAMEVLEFDASGMGELLFILRSDEEAAPVSIPTDGLVIKEIANAYELDDGQIVIDAVVSEGWDVQRAPDENEPPLWETQDPSMLPPSRLVRYECDLYAKTARKRDVVTGLIGNTTVNPSVSGKKHRFVFGAVAHDPESAGPPAGVAKIDVESGSIDTWVPGPSEFGSALCFLPKQGENLSEDDGYLIAVVFNGASQSSNVVVLDAKNPSQGPVCSFSLRAPLPHAARSCWAAGLTVTEEELKRKFVLLRMFEKKAQSWNEINTGFAAIGKEISKQGGRLR